jgi:FkbM family methyltransferase
MSMLRNRLFRGIRSVSRASEIIRCIKQTRQWPEVIPGYLGVQDLVWPYEFSLRNGHTIDLADWSDLTTIWAVLFGDEYRVSPDDEVIVDLGANIGAFTLMALATAPHANVFAVEPFPTSFARLEACVRRNAVGDRVECRQLAITGYDGMVTMDGAPGIASHSRRLLPEDKVAEPVAVRGVSLRQFVEQESLTHIDYLKMDIEGAEFEVIEHAPVDVLRRAKVIGLEVHGDQAEFGKLWDKFKLSGFDERRLARRPFWMTVEFERH